ncbi:uncharacterized protein LOC129755049 [Uranotaenia lowii]|uniref:uncharacterized protein LOC129755049 n=1 Tax=Uranotaenia lowii TaxID=190385 RepID=UPI00247B1242|nr:uncharacterized protein LOC129755049 [Uranotaenia lowii]
MQRLLVLIAWLPLIPLIGITLFGFGCYRLVVEWLLRRKHGTSFKGLVGDIDAMWDIDREVDSGIVNAVAYMEIPSAGVANFSDAAHKIRQIIIERFTVFHQDKGHQVRKFFWKRNQAFGFSYWTEKHDVIVEDYIQMMENESFAENDTVNLSKILNKKMLSADNSAQWEILVSTQPIVDSITGVISCMIVVRFHHSLCDGVTFLRFIGEEITNPEDRSSPQPRKLPIVNKWKKYALTLYEAPFIITSLFLKKLLDNKLKRKTPMAHKYFVSKHVNTNIWNQFRNQVKKEVPNVHYSSIVLTAVSATLNNYFKAIKQTPSVLEVALPTIMKPQNKKLTFENTFSLLLQDLPMKCEINDRNDFFEALRAINKTYHSHRHSSQLLILYGIMKILPDVLPTFALRYLSRQFPVTMGVSLLGDIPPKFQFGPFALEKYSFWPPSFGTVGISLTMQSYGGQLQLGLTADRNIFQSSQEGQALLEDLVRQIERLQQLIC